jgi:hypothetical protein
MPLQNRVTPRGDLIAVSARGTLMGSPEGYGDLETKRGAGVATVLTPLSTVRALAAGYTPSVDASAPDSARRLRANVPRH